MSRFGASLLKTLKPEDAVGYCVVALAGRPRPHPIAQDRRLLSRSPRCSHFPNDQGMVWTRAWTMEPTYDSTNFELQSDPIQRGVPAQIRQQDDNSGRTTLKKKDRRFLNSVIHDASLKHSPEVDERLRSLARQHAVDGINSSDKDPGRSETNSGSKEPSIALYEPWAVGLRQRVDVSGALHQLYRSVVEDTLVSGYEKRYQNIVKRRKDRVGELHIQRDGDLFFEIDRLASDLLKALRVSRTRENKANDQQMTFKAGALCFLTVLSLWYTGWLYYVITSLLVSLVTIAVVLFVGSCCL